MAEEIPQLPRRQKRFVLQVRGDFPDLSLDDGHCACAYVSDSHIKPKAMELITSWLRRRDVKRLEILWHWAADGAEAKDGERLDVTEFLRRSEAHELTAGHTYRVNDLTKWRH